MQSVRTEQLDDAQASSAPRHPDGPWRTAASPSWTWSHVDHRLEPPNRLVPDLSYYIRDKVWPRGGGSRFDHQTLHSIPSTFALHQEKGNLERGTESPSSTASCHLLPLRRGEDSTSGEATLGLAPSKPPTKYSSFTLCCNPLDFGCS